MKLLLGVFIFAATAIRKTLMKAAVGVAVVASVGRCLEKIVRDSFRVTSTTETKDGVAYGDNTSPRHDRSFTLYRVVSFILQVTKLGL